MANTIKQFGYKTTKMKKADDRLFPPYVTVTLDNWSTDKDGVKHISPHLVIDGEIDDYIEALKADLESVGRRAKQALKKAKISTDKFVSMKKIKLTDY